MTTLIPDSGFAAAILSARLPEETVQQRVEQIHRDVLMQSSYIKEAAFKSIHPRDLELLFRAYDERFFDGQCRRALQGRKLQFRLSPRMTNAGGKTTRFRHKTGEISFEIAIASSMLFDGFGETDRSVTACGLECRDRLQALQRIFEHELVHLIEMLCWGESNCAAPRFQEIACRFFLHRAHTHNLITRRERAAGSGIRVGSRVAFDFEGRSLTGRVNRITKRASVLVQDANGRKYSNGQRYVTYYVPITQLKLVAETSA